MLPIGVVSGLKEFIYLIHLERAWPPERPAWIYRISVCLLQRHTDCVQGHTAAPWLDLLFVLKVSKQNTERPSNLPRITQVGSRVSLRTVFLTI